MRTQLRIALILIVGSSLPQIAAAQTAAAQGTSTAQRQQPGADSARRASRSRHSRQGRRSRRALQATNAVVNEAMGDLRWGMSTREVFELLSGGVEQHYADALREAHDAIEEDDLRARQARDIQRIRASYLRFDGGPSGWEHSFLRNEFVHDEGLSMMTVRSGASQDFYFFANGKLFKWYRAFQPDVFDGRTEDEVSRSFQGRFGNPSRRHENDHSWLEWHGSETRVRAMDERQFYGIYTLVFENREAADQVASLIPSEREEQSHPLVEAVTAYDENATSRHPDIVDHITGRQRSLPETSVTRSNRPRTLRVVGEDEDEAALRRREGAESVPTVRNSDDDA